MTHAVRPSSIPLAFVAALAVACVAPQDDLASGDTGSDSDTAGEDDDGDGDGDDTSSGDLACELPASTLGPDEEAGPGVVVEIVNGTGETLYLNQGGCSGFIFESSGLDLTEWPTCRPSCEALHDDPDLACSPCAIECTPTERWVAPLDAAEAAFGSLPGYLVQTHELEPVACLDNMCPDGSELWDSCVTLHPIPTAQYELTLRAWTEVQCCPFDGDGDCRPVDAADECEAGEIPNGAGDELEMIGTFSYPDELEVTIALPS